MVTDSFTLNKRIQKVKLKMDIKEILSLINEKQLQTLTPISEFREKDTKKLPRGRRGLYWIWTNLGFEELQQMETKSESKEVPIDLLVKFRQNLSFTYQTKLGNFYVVYNGKGGYVKSPSNFGLRERRMQELNCTNSQIGTLNLINRNAPYNSLVNWKVSYFDFDAEENQHILNLLDCKENHYIKYSNILELCWRIEFGIPVLNRI